jgi:hypothetical protein
MNLIETYVSEVGSRLPRKMRSDIEAELRSTLEDMLEERSREAKRPVDDEMIFEVLKKYGAPEKVAASYLPERYLIGPRLYPIFTLVLRIVLTVTGVMAAIGLGIAVYQTTLTPANAAQVILTAIANLATAIIIALGNMVLIFAILEWAIYRAGGKMELKDLPKSKEWDPRSLTKIMPSNKVKMGETIAEIVACFAAIIIFNFYPGIIGFTPSLNGVVNSGWAVGFGSSPFTPLLSEAFFRYVPYMTAVWGLTILLDIVLLRMGNWNNPARLSLIGLKVIGIIIAAFMLAGPSLVTVTAETLTASLHDAGTAQLLMTMLSMMVKGVLWLMIVLTGIDIVKLVHWLIFNKPLTLNALKVG